MRRLTFEMISCWTTSTATQTLQYHFLPERVVFDTLCWAPTGLEWCITTSIGGENSSYFPLIPVERISFYILARTQTTWRYEISVRFLSVGVPLSPVAMQAFWAHTSHAAIEATNASQITPVTTTKVGVLYILYLIYLLSS